MFTFRYLNDAPLVGVGEFADLEGNINGPSLIATPAWMRDPPGRYLLYFAHHEGRSIRLAASDALTGPWRLQRPALTLEHSGFAIRAPLEHELHAEAREFIARDADGDYPHIASPDVLVDQGNRQLRLYYHGRLDDGRQRTRVALAQDGVRFEVQDGIVGLPYMRLFEHGDWHYALSMPAQLYRSKDGLSAFETGPQLTDAPIRHHAVLNLDDRLYLFWTRVGDAPERILMSRIETGEDWQSWRLGEPAEVHRAQKPWEGGDLPVLPSAYGAVHGPVNQLRDPAIYVEDRRIYLLYSVAGEQGIAIGELSLPECD